MPADETEGSRGGGVLKSLLSPLRLPERALEAIDSLASVAHDLLSEVTRVREQTEPLTELVPIAGEIREQAQRIPEVLSTAQRISEQAQPLAEVLPALGGVERSLATRVDSLHELVAGLASKESELNKQIAEVHKELTSMHKTVSGLQEDLQRITDRLPDPGENRGPLEAARDLLTGSSD